MADPESDYQIALLLQHQIEETHRINLNQECKSDLELALTLQAQFEHEISVETPAHNLVYENKKKPTGSRPDKGKSLVDPSWEVIDPTPDVHVLFVAFNERFFWNQLVTVAVSWSKRMTTCAGICSYQGRGGMCSITLSEPLLKLRPRKDLVETLLHEMIHAYLFVTHNNRDRSGHGPEFHKHMYRINGEAGTNITVYHDFHDEVRLYKQHWWRCNGPCQNSKPYFGMVKRATNRAPGPNDFWWAEHERRCGGKFIKVKEPEKPKPTGKENKQKPVTSTGVDIRTYVSVNGKTKSSISTPKNGVGAFVNTTNTRETNRNEINSTNTSSTAAASNIYGFNSSGSVINIKVTKDSVNTISSTKSVTPIAGNIHGYNKTGSLGSTALKSNSSSTVVVRKRPSNSDGSEVIPKKVSPTSKKLSDSVKGSTSPGYDAVRSHWINKYANVPSTSQSSVKNAADDLVTCPICQKQFDEQKINDHLDTCLQKDSEKIPDSSTSNLPDTPRDLVLCEICDSLVDKNDLNKHHEQCISSLFKDEEDEGQHIFNSSWTDSPDNKEYSCPFCMKMFPEEHMNAHLNMCLDGQEDDDEAVLNKTILIDSFSDDF